MNNGLYGMPRGRRKKLTHTKFMGVRVYRGSTLTLTNSVEISIPWDVVVWDVGGFVRVSDTTKLVAPVDGWYEVGASASVANGASRAILRIYKGTTTAAKVKNLSQFDEGGSSSWWATCTALEHFAAGDNAEICINQLSGSNQTNGAADATSQDLCCAYMIRRG